MSIGTLYTIDIQNKGRIIKAVAEIAGIQLDKPANYTHFETNKTKEFTDKFPGGKIPALELKDGFKLFEAIPIARYLATKAPNSDLLGHSPEDAALIDQWVHYVESELDNNVGNINLLVRGVIPYNKPTHTIFIERQERTLAVLEKHISTRTFFVGERITLADIVVAGLIQRAAAVTLGATERAKIPHLIRHFETVANQPKIAPSFGKIEYIEKPLQYTPPAKEKKEPKPAAAPQPKAEKPRKPAKEDDDEDVDLVPAEPKTRNPLEDLPPTAFNLEQWKREYSNKDTRGAGGSLEWFYANFDKAGFSIWRVDFKYNSELTQTFMSSNQIGGFFNRLEASRKYLFGSVGVLGQTNDSVISGVFILRGQKVEGVIDAAPDWESYAYQRLDYEDPKQKEFFEAALAWDLELEGKKWVDGKNFK